MFIKKTKDGLKQATEEEVKAAFADRCMMGKPIEWAVMADIMKKGPGWYSGRDGTEYAWCEEVESPESNKLFVGILTRETKELVVVGGQTPAQAYHHILQGKFLASHPQATETTKVEILDEEFKTINHAIWEAQGLISNPNSWSHKRLAKIPRLVAHTETARPDEQEEVEQC